LADAIGEIGGSVLGEEAHKSEWPDIIPNIFKLIQTGTANNIESGLVIVGSMMTYCVEEFLKVKAQLLELLKMGIEHPENKVKLAAVEALGSVVEACENKEMKQFEILLVPAL